LQPVLIPHTRLRARLAANPQTTTIHPSIVKEQVGPRFALLSASSGADTKKVMRARKRSSAGDF